MDRLISSYIVGTNKKTFNGYDKNGNCIWTAIVTGSGAEQLTAVPSDGYFVEKTVYTFDSKNRLTSTTAIGGSYGNRTTTTEYNDESNFVAKEKTATANILYSYNELGQVIETEKTDGVIASNNLSSYDNKGNVIAETGSSGTVTTEYDSLGRVTLSVNEKEVEEKTEYGTNDDGSTYTVITKEQGDTVLSKELTVNDSWGNTVLQGSCAINGETGSFDYLDMSLNSYTQSVYDSVGTLISTTDNTGTATSFEYDSLEQVLSETTSKDGNNTVISYTYDDAGNKLTQTDSDGTVTYNTYDWLLRITKKEQLAQDGTVLEVHELRYDEDNNILQEKTTQHYNGSRVIDRLYEYDWLKRLIKENVSGAAVSYSYDNVGNRLTMTSGGDTYSYSYNDKDQLTQIKKGNTVVESYAYDLAGNQVSKSESGKTTEYTYDLANQLEKVQIDGNVVSEYSYDARGQRLTKKTGANETKYFYDGLNLLYTRENDTLSEVNILSIDGDIVLGLRGSDEYRYIKDIRGSVTNILDSSEQLVLSYTYDAYGNTTSSNKDFKNSFAYTGAVIDDEISLYYMNSRYYDPATGRFISQDSYRGDGETFWHLYAYCNSDPVNNTDPTGNEAITFIAMLTYTAFIVMTSLMLVISSMLISRFNVAWNNMAAQVGRNMRSYLAGVAGAYSWITTEVEKIAWSVKRSFANSAKRTRYPRKDEHHHKVAKGAYKAVDARMALLKVNIGVNHSRNMIWLKTGLHRRIHNNLYYNYTNNLVVNAYKKGRTFNNKQKYVFKTLDSIGRFLKGLNNISPY